MIGIALHQIVAGLGGRREGGKCEEEAAGLSRPGRPASLEVWLDLIGRQKSTGKQMVLQTDILAAGPAFALMVPSARATLADSPQAF